LHDPAANAATLIFRIDCHSLDVGDVPPWLVAEADAARHRAGVVDQTTVLPSQHVDASEGVVAVLIVEAVTERPIPERPRFKPGWRVHLETLHDGDYCHDSGG